ncbi:MAG: outer membrane lipoprotein chaperone LolA [Tahibacter sp.]
MIRLVVVITALLALQSHAAADSARTRLDTFAKGLRGLSGAFVQNTFDANDKPGKQTRGTLALQTPRQFRWDVTAPYQQQIVADGMHVWIYDPDLEQVTVRNQGVEESHSPLTVLTDLGQLDHEFSASEQGDHDGLSWLRLKSRAKEPDFEYADLGLGLGADGSSLQRMQFKDALGNRTEIQFSEWKRNPEFPASRFHFDAPPGVDVIGEVKPEAEVHPVKD